MADKRSTLSSDWEIIYCLFGLPGPYKMLRKLHKTLTTKSNQDAVLIANGIFSQEGFPMEASFVSTNKENFQSEARSLDFSNPEVAANEINEWVNNKTKGRSQWCT